MRHTLLCSMALVAVLLTGTQKAMAQGMAINKTGAAAAATAMLDVSDTAHGILVPRMTLSQKNAISSPATGLLVFQTDGTAGFYYYTGAAWAQVGGSPTGAASGDLTGSYPGPTIASTAGGDIVTAINASASSIDAARLQATVTAQGNTFNGASQLVQMTGATKLPAVNGSLLNNLTAGNLTAGGTFPAENGSALTSLTAGNLSAGGTFPAENGSALTSLTVGNLSAGGTFPAENGSALTSLTAGNLSAGGTFPAENGSALTSLTAGNLSAGGTFPAENGSALTTLNATNLSSGTVAAARLGTGAGANTLLHGNQTFSAVDLANDVTGNLGTAHLNGGSGASASTFWCGNGTWAGVTVVPSSTLRVVTTSATIFSTDQTVGCTSATNFTYTLPTAAAFGNGKILYLLANGLGSMTVVCVGGDTMLAGGSSAIPSDAGIKFSIFLISDGGTHWYVMQAY